MKKLSSVVAAAAILAGSITALPARAQPGGCVKNGVVAGSGNCPAGTNKRHAPRKQRRGLVGKDYIATPPTGPATVTPTP